MLRVHGCPALPLPGQRPSIEDLEAAVTPQRNKRVGGRVIGNGPPRQTSSLPFCMCHDPQGVTIHEVHRLTHECIPIRGTHGDQGRWDDLRLVWKRDSIYDAEVRELHSGHCLLVDRDHLLTARTQENSVPRGPATLNPTLLVARQHFAPWAKSVQDNNITILCDGNIPNRRSGPKPPCILHLPEVPNVRARVTRDLCGDRPGAPALATQETNENAQPQHIPQSSRHGDTGRSSAREASIAPSDMSSVLRSRTLAASQRASTGILPVIGVGQGSGLAARHSPLRSRPDHRASCIPPPGRESPSGHDTRGARPTRID